MNDQPIDMSDVEALSDRQLMLEILKEVRELRHNQDAFHDFELGEAEAARRTTARHNMRPSHKF